VNLLRLNSVSEYIAFQNMVKRLCIRRGSVFDCQAVDEVRRSNESGKPFDLILMDVQMPVTTGREAVAEIRRAGFSLPIIALTAGVMEGERQACIDMGCDEYFPKPIDGPKLMDLVKSMV